MADSAQDRKLPASERKIRKAREDGQVARSRDLGHLAALGAGAALIAATAPLLLGWAQRLLAEGLRFDHRAVISPATMVERLADGSVDGLVLVLPLGAAMLLAALAAGVLAGGWNFSWKALEPTWSKIDPIAGFGRMVSMQQMGVMLKACGLALVLGLIGAVFLWQQASAFAALLAMPLPAALARTGDLVVHLLMWLLLPLAAFAVVDVPLQRTLLLRRLRMSHEEVKQEHKEVEGNQSVKSRMRQRMREMASRRMLAAVPGADLVVMNPTHFAVALKYDEKAMGAPRVVAKGADLIALRIRDVAREAGVPVLQAPPLARALYAHTELDEEIPAALFSAVAQVLAWVFQLRQAGSARAVLLATPPQPVVPPGMDPNDDLAPEGAAT